MAMAFLVLLVGLIALSSSLVTGQLSQNRDELLNWCLKSENHKPKPGKEDVDTFKCPPWKDHACCTADTAIDIHNLNMYNFTIDHCQQQTRKQMSPKCLRFFLRDTCFYECEPHIGLWVVEVNRKISSERFYGVPLCASECDKWFDVCKDDFTCARNWMKDFKFKHGANSCKEGSQCVNFKEMYTDAKQFCESVYDNAWKYTPDSEPCMKLWFEGDNPNKEVAQYYIDQRFPATDFATSLRGPSFFSALVSAIVSSHFVIRGLSIY